MGALRRLSDTTCELKRLRVDPAYQGSGYGQEMLAALEKTAKALGYEIIVLDTTVRQVAAQKLYEKFGYKEFNRETEGWPLETIFYSKPL